MPVKPYKGHLILPRVDIVYINKSGGWSKITRGPGGFVKGLLNYIYVVIRHVRVPVAGNQISRKLGVYNRKLEGSYP